MKKDQRPLVVGTEVAGDPELRAARAFLNRQVDLLDAARQRFYGGDTKEAAKWMLDLIQQPVEEVRTNWEIRWGIEVTAFAAVLGGTAEANIISLRELQAEHIIPILDRLRGALVALAQGQQPPVFRVTLEFGFALDLEAGGSFDIQDRTGDLVGGFLWGARKVLGEMRRDVKVCARPGCGVWFVRSTAGRYHSTSCSQRVRTEKWLGKKEVRQVKERTRRTPERIR